jgi:hypothetical protein
LRAADLLQKNLLGNSLRRYKMKNRSSINRYYIDYTLKPRGLPLL